MRDAHGFVVSAALLALAAFAIPAHAQVSERLGGHLSLGYSQLVVKDSPGGSISVSGGIDYPIVTGVRVGADVGFALLGSRTISEAEDTQQIANLDYSTFEAALLLHVTPKGWGPIGRVSVGPELMSARADLSTSGGGIPFTRFAIEEVAPGIAADVTLLKNSSHSPVRAGLEVGAHFGFLESETWTILSMRLAIHY